LAKIWACRYRLDKRCFRDYVCSSLTALGNVDYCPIYFAVKFPSRKVKPSPVSQVALVFGNKFSSNRGGVHG
jgi:hypothetical protein